jgi:signal peptidase I
MKSEQVWARVLASFLLPGLGQALTGRRMRAIAWGVAGLASVVGILWVIWLLYGGLVVRLACAVDAYLCTRQPASSRPGFVIATSILGGLGLMDFVLGYAAFRAPSTSMLPSIEAGDKVYVDTVSHVLRDFRRGEVIVFRQPCTPEREYIKRVVAVGGDRLEVRCGVVYVNGKAVPAELVAAERTYAERDEGGARYERRVSHYRETMDGVTFEIYDDVERPERREQSTKDYPLDRAPSCSDSSDPDVSSSVRQPAIPIEVTNATAGACEPRAHVVVPKNTVFVMGDARNNSNDSRFWGVVTYDLVVGRVIGIWSPIGRTGGL